MQYGGLQTTAALSPPQERQNFYKESFYLPKNQHSGEGTMQMVLVSKVHMFGGTPGIPTRTFCFSNVPFQRCSGGLFAGGWLLPPTRPLPTRLLPPIPLSPAAQWALQLDKQWSLTALPCLSALLLQPIGHGAAFAPAPGMLWPWWVGFQNMVTLWWLLQFTLLFLSTCAVCSPVRSSTGSLWSSAELCPGVQRLLLGFGALLTRVVVTCFFL